MSCLYHVSREVKELTLCHHAAHCLGLSFQEVLQHEDALFLGASFVETSPVASAPELLSNDVCLLSVPCKQCDAVEEGVGVTLSDVVVNCQSVREADCSVVGVASCAGVIEGEVHVLLCVVSERTTREGWECLCGNECE